MTLSVMSTAVFAATPADLKAKIDAYGEVDFANGDFDTWKTNTDDVLDMYENLDDEAKAEVDEPDLDIINEYIEFRTNAADYETAYDIYDEIVTALADFNALSNAEKEDVNNKQSFITAFEAINADLEASNLKVLDILGGYNYGDFDKTYTEYSDKLTEEALNLLTGPMVRLAGGKIEGEQQEITGILGGGAGFAANGVQVTADNYLEVRKYINNIVANYDKLCDVQKDYLDAGLGSYNTENYFGDDENYAYRLEIIPGDYIKAVKDAESAFIPAKETYFNEKIDELEAVKSTAVKYDEAKALNDEYTAFAAKVNTSNETLFDSTGAILDAITDLLGFNKAMKDFAEKVNDVNSIVFAKANYAADMLKITDVETVYNGLTQEQKNNEVVKSYKDILDAKRSALEAFGDEAVSEVETAISAIGTITYDLEALERVDAARAKYNELDSYLQGKVSNYGVLTDAETAVADYRKAIATDNLINAIGNVGTLATDDIQLTTNCKNAIDAARASYDALTDTQKALTTKYANLTAAESEYATLVNDKATIESYIAAFEADEANFEYTTTATFDTIYANYESAKSYYDGLAHKAKLGNIMTGAEALHDKIKAFQDALEALDNAVDNLINAYSEWQRKYIAYGAGLAQPLDFNDYADHATYISDIALQAGEDMLDGFGNIFITDDLLGEENSNMFEVAEKAYFQKALNNYNVAGYTIDYTVGDYQEAEDKYNDFKEAYNAYMSMVVDDGKFEDMIEQVSAWAEKVMDIYNNDINPADGTFIGSDFNAFVVAMVGDDGEGGVVGEYNGFDTWTQSYISYQENEAFNRYYQLVALSVYYVEGYRYVYGYDDVKGVNDYYAMDYADADAYTQSLADLYATLADIVKSVPEVEEAHRKYLAMAWGIDAYKALADNDITLAAIYNLKSTYAPDSYVDPDERAKAQYDALQAKEVELVETMIDALDYANYETQLVEIDTAYAKLSDEQKANVTNYKKVEYTKKAIDAVNASGTIQTVVDVDHLANAIEEIYRAYYGTDSAYAALAFEIIEKKAVLANLRNAIVEFIDEIIENSLPNHDDIAALDITDPNFYTEAMAYKATIDTIDDIYRYFDIRKENADTAELKAMYNKMSVDAKMAVTKYAKYELCKNKLEEKIAEYNSYKAERIIYHINSIRDTIISAANYGTVFAELTNCTSQYHELNAEQKAIVDANYEAGVNYPKPIEDAIAECDLYVAAYTEAQAIINEAEDVLNTYSGNITDANYKDVQAAATAVIEKIADASDRAKEFGLDDYDERLQALIESTRDVEEYMSVVESIEALRAELYDDVVNNAAINSEYGVRIAETEKKFNDLTPDKKLKVSNYSTLKVMREAYDANVATAIADTKAAIDAIPALDEITKPDDGDVIDTAWEKFSSLSAENQAKLGEDYINKMKDSKAKYDTLYDANDVMNMIDALENPSTLVITDANIAALKQAVNAAREAYDSLNNAQKVEVTNYSKLTILEGMVGTYANKPGDADNNGTVDIFDVLAMIDAALERTPLTGDAFDRCNIVKGDGEEDEVIDIFDILEVLKLIEF